VAELIEKCGEVESCSLNPEDAKTCIDEYLGVDGRVEYLLDGLLEELDDRYFDERDFREWLLGDSATVSELPKYLKPTKKTAKELLNGIPHPLDDDFEWLRFHVRGGGGRGLCVLLGFVLLALLCTSLLQMTVTTHSLCSSLSLSLSLSRTCCR
jgi:hypothetical protein